MNDPKLLLFAYIGMLTCLAALTGLLAYLYHYFFPNE